MLRIGRISWCSLALVAASCDRGAAPPGPRHVLLISVDTLRADHVGSYGGACATPALDELARTGTRFADCTAAAATTLASHTSLMTGTFPRTHGVPRNGFVLSPDNLMLAERFAAAGFWCAAFLGSFALDERFGFDQGFHHYDQEFDVEVGAAGADQDQRSAAAVTAALLAHVDVVRARDGFEREGRLFLFAHYFDPHAPYAPPGGASPTLGVGSLPRIGAAVAARQAAMLGVPAADAPGLAGVVARGLSPALVAAPSPPPSDEERALAALYAAEVEALDRSLGALFLGLEARGVLADTLIVVTADHGETFWEHPNAWNHGLHVHQTDVHVPLIVRSPDGRGAGRVVADPVSSVDVAPTLIELMGLAPHAPSARAVEGVSLARALDGASLAERALFSEATQPGPVVEPEGAGVGTAWWNQAKPRAARLGRWKLVQAPYLGYEALYDVVADPGEHLDRRSDPAASAPYALLRSALELYDERPPALPARFDPAQSAETLRRLEALGYFESGK